MSDKRKFREWWIDEQKHDMLQSVFDRPVEGCVHVIEHSAYLALESEALKLEAALDWALDGICRHSGEKHPGMNREWCLDCSSWVYQSDKENLKLADDALEQFKKWKQENHTSLFSTSNETQKTEHIK